jgi:hypothetical protein
VKSASSIVPLSVLIVSLVISFSSVRAWRR